jgi:heterodisulfide reductase subunit C
MMKQTLDLTSHAHESTALDAMASVQDKIQACMQCGTCTGSCPNAFAMDLTPRHMWRLAQLGQKDAIFKSKTFFLCSACYSCTLRCPRGLPLTETIDALKRIAAAEDTDIYKSSTRFYGSFMNTVRRYGRVREMEFMQRYFLSMKNPFLPFRFASLGMKLMGKAKVSFEMPKFFGEGRFDAMFRKVEELETK